MTKNRHVLQVDLIVRGIQWWYFIQAFNILYTILTIQPQTLGHNGVYLSLPHFTLQLFLNLEILRLQNLWFSSKGWKVHFVIEKVQFRGPRNWTFSITKWLSILLMKITSFAVAISPDWEIAAVWNEVEIGTPRCDPKFEAEWWGLCSVKRKLTKLPPLNTPNYQINLQDMSVFGHNILFFSFLPQPPTPQPCHDGLFGALTDTISVDLMFCGTMN